MIKRKARAITLGQFQVTNSLEDVSGENCMDSRSDDDKESDKELVKASQEAVSLSSVEIVICQTIDMENKPWQMENKPWPLGCRLMRLTSPQKSREELARASPIFWRQRKSCCLLRRRISYLNLALDLRFIWNRTPTECYPASDHTRCQKFTLAFRFLAASLKNSQVERLTIRI